MKIAEPRFSLIPMFTTLQGVTLDVHWPYLLTFLEGQKGLDLDPDFQRAHVWTEAQQVAYVEYVLRGGRSGLDLYFNHPGWFTQEIAPYVVVDGKQRLHAVVRFLRNEVRAFGHLYRDFKDSPRYHLSRFHWHVNTLQTRSEVLTWYLELNTGGTPHTQEEIDRVRALLSAERGGAHGA